MLRTQAIPPLVACVVGVFLFGVGVVRAVAPDAGLPASRVGPPVAVAVDRPVRIDLPTLRVRAPVEPVAVQGGGDLVVPENPHVVGWWAAGGGTLVLDGHVDTAAGGPGALFRLSELATGDAIGLTGVDGAVQSYVVTSVRTYLKADLPAEVFGPSESPRLVIITCGGHFNRSTRQYANNVVAFADPA
jgi:hypothetical protein